jgi:D-3-phosphoglycerate dehydrogenase / 2-oxoglutarate reductase
MKNNFLITETVPSFFIDSLVNAGYEVRYYPEITSYELERIIGDFEYLLIRSRIILNKSLLEKAFRLKAILRPGSGLDIIDQEIAVKRNIRLINSPEGNRDAVAEHALGLLLGMLNHIPKSFNEFSNWEWTRKKNIGEQLMNRTIGIIGYGNTGCAFAQRLSGLNVQVIAYDKYKTGFSDSFVNEVKEAEIFAASDILSLHIPLTSETEQLVNQTYLDKFSKSIWLINTSRGKIIHTSDLCEAINSGKVRGACLDVVENEDFYSQSIKERTDIIELLQTQKVIITPHIAGLTVQSEEQIFRILLEKLLN